MERVTLYNKWRPQIFAEVIGQPHVTETIANALKGKKLSHAYLFTGPRGTGKTSTARILAKSINCERGPTPDPCNACYACTSITEGTALDVIEIDAASNRRIDEIRDLLEKIPYAPTVLRKKVYIIDEVHQLTPEASSALLKTLEEPPDHIVFILATTEPQKMLATIMSRCQRFEFKLVNVSSIVNLLKRITEAEELRIDEDALVLIAEHSAGSVRDAIGALDQVSSMPAERITLELVASVLGEIEASLLIEMTDLLAEKDTPGCLTLLDRLIESGREPRRFVESLIRHLRELFLLQNAANPREIVRVTDEHYSLLEDQAGRIPPYEVNRLLDKLARLHREMRWSENQRVILECGIVEMTRIDVDVSLEGLLFRIERLEKRLDGGLLQRAAVRDAGSIESRAQRKREEEVAGITSAESAKEEMGFVRSDAEGALEQEGLALKESGGRAEASGIPNGTKRPQRGKGKLQRVETGGTKAEREQARRTLSAVLAELKRQGKIKTYALLMKAKIVSATAGVVELGFTGGGSFSASVLRESGEMERIAEIWSEITGAPVEIHLQGEDIPGEERERDSREKNLSDGTGTVPVSEGKDRGTQGEKELRRQHSGFERQDSDHVSDKVINEESNQGSGDEGRGFERGSEERSQGERENARDKSARKPGEIARLLKDEFGGEILK